MNKNSLIVLVIAVVVVAGIVIYALVGKDDSPEPITEITSFEECVAAGHPVMESYPRQCSDGTQTFTENVGNSVEKMDLVRLESPQAGTTVRSPLALSGEARGNWFFEATAPAKLYDSTGALVAQGYIQAEGEWMTTEFVPFAGTLTWTTDPAAGVGKLVLEKSNASGLPEHDDMLWIPVTLE